MFKKILIANRGEIACRVIKTAKKMKIKTVSIFSEADRNSEHVLLSDESYYIGNPDVNDSYLNQEKILKVCKKAKVDAVHPGYGFLSENSSFSDLLKSNNIVFIGPPSKAISDMGDKIKSKDIAKKANVNIIPGFIGEINNSNDAIKVSNDIGFPVMIKASAGGGGKGMRIANNEKEIDDNFKRASSEAQKSFGDGRVFIEKYIQNPRHIEIQILADNYGNIISLGERECSIQRRNQKVIEEAPSSFLDEKLREEMSKQAIKLASNVDYNSAGTVEFIVDSNKKFYFLEMNTRLQVEHPVTELITGVDIVEEMIKIAAGEKLILTKNDVKLKGWSFESRIYAEDPYKDFLPSIGRLKRYFPPKEVNHNNQIIRNDTGVKEGDEITIYYDPMIAKLSTWGKTREDAIRYMLSALDRFMIQGVKNNISFLSAVLSNKDFKDGNISTSFIEQHFSRGFKGISFKRNEEIIYISLLALNFDQIIRSNQKKTPPALFFIEIIDEFDNQKYLSKEYSITFDNDFFFISYPEGVKIYNKVYKDIKIRFKKSFENNLCNFEFFSKKDIIFEYCCDIQFMSPFTFLKYGGISVKGTLKNKNSVVLSKFLKDSKSIDILNQLKCPMPGKLIEVLVDVGFDVEAGDKICIVEAMKMENVLLAPKSGKVKKINFKVNDILSVGSVIMEF